MGSSSLAGVRHAEAAHREDDAARSRHAQAEKDRHQQAKAVPKVVVSTEVSPARRHAAEIFSYARQLVRRFRFQTALPIGSGNRSLRENSILTPGVNFTVASRGFQRGQGQHPLWRPTHPLVLATRRHRPVVVFLHPCAGDP